MGSLKNNKHEVFTQKWHETGNKTEAYRVAFPRSLNWKDATTNNKASALSKKGEVLARYEELQKEAENNHGITIKSLIAELDENRQAALEAETPQASAATAATMAKAKLVGLDVRKVDLTSSDGSMTPNQEMTDDEFMEKLQDLGVNV